MKIFVIHGDDTIKSYARLTTFIETAKKRNWEVLPIDHDTKNSLREILSMPSLFGDERFYVVKDVKIITDKDIEWINKSKTTGNLVLFSERKILATFLKKFKGIEKTEEFSLPFLVFKFLDYLYPGNIKQVLNSLSDLLKTQAPEFIFSLISKHMRDLYWSTLSDKPTYPSWRVSKLSSQASKFKPHQLKKIISDLSKIDYNAKIGQAVLANELDLVLVTSLK